MLSRRPLGIGPHLVGYVPEARESRSEPSDKLARDPSNHERPFDKLREKG